MFQIKRILLLGAALLGGAQLVDAAGVAMGAGVVGTVKRIFTVQNQSTETITLRAKLPGTHNFFDVMTLRPGDQQVVEVGPWSEMYFVWQASGKQYFRMVAMYPAGSFVFAVKDGGKVDVFVEGPVAKADGAPAKAPAKVTEAARRGSLGEEGKGSVADLRGRVEKLQADLKNLLDKLYALEPGFEDKEGPKIRELVRGERSVAVLQAGIKQLEELIKKYEARILSYK